jgi:hypothetical protein
MDGKIVAGIVSIIILSVIVLNGKEFGMILEKGGTQLVNFTKAANGGK